MDEMTEQNFEVIEEKSPEMRGMEVFEQNQESYQTIPIKRKLLDFSFANKTSRFSVRDLFRR